MTHPFAVAPVVDYEPPPVAYPSQARARVPTPAPHRPGVRPPCPTPPTTPGQPPTARAAAAFADRALRGVLEAIDGRRPPNQLSPLLAAGLIDRVRAQATRSRPSSALRPATLRRVGLRIVGRDAAAAEVFGTYTRAGRVRAIAGRIERNPARDAHQWNLVALHVG